MRIADKPVNIIMLRLFMLVCLAVLFTGCTHLSSQYLDDAKGKAIQAEVIEKLGTPVEMQTLDNGESQWLYHKKHYSSVGVRTICQVFALRFDSRMVLKEWDDQEVECDAEHM